jgi:uncharacterized protein with FMN-binding domain
MRRAIAALIVTAVAVVLLARYDAHPPRTVKPEPRPRAEATPRPRGRTATGIAITTPFSVVQVQVTLRHGRIVDVRTVSLSSNGPHTEAINRRAEPILRREALRAGTPHIDIVSGATGTSTAWISSLRSAVERARG